MTFRERTDLLAENKRAIVAARRIGDDDAAKRLSQERQALKRKRFCLDCERPVNKGSVWCYQHYIMNRFHRRSLPA